MEFQGVAHFFGKLPTVDRAGVSTVINSSGIVIPNKVLIPLHYPSQPILTTKFRAQQALRNTQTMRPCYMRKSELFCEKEL